MQVCTDTHTPIRFQGASIPRSVTVPFGAASLSKRGVSLYADFQKTPSRHLLRFIQEKIPTGSTLESAKVPPLLFADLQARYGMHVNGDEPLIRLKVDPLSRALATPQTIAKVRTILEQPTVQQVMTRLNPRQQLQALSVIVDDSEGFCGFAWELMNPVVQSFFQQAENPYNRFHPLVFSVSPGTGKPLMDDFHRLYAMFRPTRNNDTGPQPIHPGNLGDIPHCVVGSSHFPPQETFRPGFDAMFFDAKGNVETQERLLLLASARESGSAIRFNHVSKAYLVHGGRELAGFLSKIDRTGQKTAQLIDLLIGYRPRPFNGEEKWHPLVTSRFLTVSTLWILNNPKVPDQTKYHDIIQLMHAVPDPQAFLKAWRKMQRRYPFFPSIP